ncbi:transposase [Rhodoblastus sp. 17X3]
MKRMRTPRQRSSGSKDWLGRITTMGDRYLRMAERAQ